MAKSRRHQLIITVTFDRQCTRQHALTSVRDCIHGGFYPTPVNPDDPEEFKVRGFKMGRGKAVR